MLVTISIMSVAYLLFYRTGPSSRTDRLFESVPCFTPSFEGNPLTTSVKFCHEILENLSYHTVKARNFHLTWALIGTGL